MILSKIISDFSREIQTSFSRVGSLKHTSEPLLWQRSIQWRARDFRCNRQTPHGGLTGSTETKSGPHSTDQQLPDIKNGVKHVRPNDTRDPFSTLFPSLLLFFIRTLFNSSWLFISFFFWRFFIYYLSKC